MDDRATLARRFYRHGRSVHSTRMYADLMLRCARDIEAGGPVLALMAGHAGPPDSVPALRLLGAVHRLVLTGRAPELAAFYPSAGGLYDGDAAWPAFLRVVSERAGELAPYLDRTVQTNEPARAAALLPGFAAVSREYGRPLRLLEVGASAGLLLRWDAYRYEWDGGGWGPPDSPVVLTAAAVDVDPALRVADRRGCDRSPVDVTTEEGRLTLLSYVWPDQPERLARLRAAFAVAAAAPATVDRADAVEWTRARLAADHGGAVPVVYHSIVMQYLPPDARAAFAAVVRAGDAPRAWLRFEPEGAEFVVRLTTWPGGEERVLAHANPHGYGVTLLTT
ncbi:MAG TPA: DUF2332 domain-containing protein [Mycobacteriales bacterium]|nr:DUF2332 domain-containing protein [Mycobacteriales bacterium]